MKYDFLQARLADMLLEVLRVRLLQGPRVFHVVRLLETLLVLHGLHAAGAREEHGGKVGVLELKVPLVVELQQGRRKRVHVLKVASVNANFPPFFEDFFK